MPPNQSHIFPRQQHTYYYNSVGGPGPLAGLIIGLIIVLAVVILGGWALHRQNKRRREKEAVGITGVITSYNSIRLNRVVIGCSLED